MVFNFDKLQRTASSWESTKKQTKFSNTQDYLNPKLKNQNFSHSKLKIHAETNPLYYRVLAPSAAKSISNHLLY